MPRAPNPIDSADEALPGAGKPVFQIEYTKPLAGYCPSANHQGFSTLKKQPALFAYPWVPCR